MNYEKMSYKANYYRNKKNNTGYYWGGVPLEKNIKDVEVTLGQTWEIQNALKKTLKEMVGDKE